MPTLEQMRDWQYANYKATRGLTPMEKSLINQYRREQESKQSTENENIGCKVPHQPLDGEGVVETVSDMGEQMQRTDEA